MCGSTMVLVLRVFRPPPPVTVSSSASFRSLVLSVIGLILCHPTEATIASVPSVIRRMHCLWSQRCSRGNRGLPDFAVAPDRGRDFGSALVVYGQNPHFSLYNRPVGPESRLSRADRAQKSRPR